MKREFGGKSLTSHVTGVPKPPPKTDPTFAQWEKADHKVFGWILKNLNPSLVNGVSQYPTAKELWDGLSVMFGSSNSSLQVYDLHRKANNIKQGDKSLDELWASLDELWARLTEIWMSIDRREPNPMKDPEDISTYNNIIQTHRLYQFLMSPDEKYDTVKKDILKTNPLHSVVAAYSIVRQDKANDQVIKPTGNEAKEIPHGVGAGNRGKDLPEETATGLAARDKGRPNFAPNRNHGGRRFEEDK